MGIYLNTGAAKFDRALRSLIYIDKTGFWNIPIRYLIQRMDISASVVQDVLGNPLQQQCYRHIMEKAVIRQRCLMTKISHRQRIMASIETNTMSLKLI